MAQVDFSNAVLDAYAGKPFGQNYYLNFDNTPTLYDISAQVIGSGSKRIISNTPSKVSILYIGTFSASGTEFYIAMSKNATTGTIVFAWKVSNISFSSGDSYSFVIDIEVSGNT